MESDSDNLTKCLLKDEKKKGQQFITAFGMRNACFGYVGSVFLLIVGILLSAFVTCVYGNSRVFSLLVSFSLLPFLSHSIIVFGMRRNLILSKPHSNSCAARETKKLSICWLVVYILLCLFVWGGIALYNYLAWWQADTWLARGWSWQGVVHWYLYTNSRIGEIVLRLVRLDYSRWLSWSTFPCCILLVILTMWKISGKKLYQLPSMAGCCHTVFVASLLMLAVYTNCTRDYHDFAAMTNYLWPTTATFLLLTRFQSSAFFYDQRVRILPSALKSLLVFLLGVFAGWGTEIGCVLFFLGIGTWILYNIYNKLYINTNAWISLIGFAWGSMMLFLSPAHDGRAADSAPLRIVNPNEMQAEELQMWLNELNWEKLHQLETQGVILLDGIPFSDHFKFLPFLAERFWDCCNVPSIAVLILLGIVMSQTGVRYKRRTVLLVVLTAYALTWLGTCTYLLKVIPGYMSFLPASYVVVLIAAWLFQQLPTKWVSQLLVALAFLSYMLWIYIPRIEIGLQYKPLERAIWHEILTQKSNGVQHIRIDKKFIPRPQINDGGLVSDGKLSLIATQYPNFLVAEYFKVKSIGYKEEVKESCD